MEEVTRIMNTEIYEQDFDKMIWDAILLIERLQEFSGEPSKEIDALLDILRDSMSRVLH